MFKNILSATLISTALIAGAAAPAFAEDMGGMTEETGRSWLRVQNNDGSSRTIFKNGNNGNKIVHRSSTGKVVKVEAKPKKPSSMSSRNENGTTTTVTRNIDGSKKITVRNAKGKVIKIQKVPAQNVPYAINHTDGVMSVGVGAGIHVVIGPFGFSIH